MPDTTMQETRVDKQLFRLLKNPVFLQALVLLIDRTASKSDIAKALGLNFNPVDHAVNALKEMGHIEAVGTEQRRGQVATLYRAVVRPIWDSEEWGKLDQDERERYAAWVVQLFMCDVAIAWKARTFQARKDAHTSRSPLVVDEQGWRDLNRIQDEALKASHEVEVESIKRLCEADDKGERIMARAVMFCIEMPPAAKR